MKLGTYAHVSISVRSLLESIPFYEKLGFKKLWENTDPHPWALLTDGGVNIHLYEFDFPSPAVHYFSSQMDEKIQELKRNGIALEQQKNKDGSRMQHNLFDPDELCVMLMHFDDANMPKPTGDSHSLLGIFGELSINTQDLNTSIEFWRKLDFTPRYESKKPYPWAILSDDVMTVGLHQTSTFTAPALTYFAGNVGERIQSATSSGLRITHELKNENNAIAGAILNAPDGQLFFILQGDV